MPHVPLIHHITLTVTDVTRSADWYQKLLGEAVIVEREGDGWKRIRMNFPSGLVIGVSQHDATPAGDSFTHARSGLDHIGLACNDEQEVKAWIAHMDANDIAHGPLEDVAYGWAVTARDPDNIPIEFFTAK